MLESLFGIIETSPEAKIETSNQPIEAGVDDQLEVEYGSQTVKEGMVGLGEESPQGLAEPSLEVELTPEIEL